VSNKQGSFSVNDFYSGHNYSTQARSTLWDMVVSRSYASWDCAADKYEKDGPKGLSGRGMRQVLRYLINPKDLNEQVYERYGRRTDLEYKVKEEMLLKTLGGTLSNQFRSKFPEIYNLHTGKRVSQLNLLDEINRECRKEKFTELNNTFNTTNTTTHKTSKPELLDIATRIAKILEPLSQGEREYVLSR
tara:strand:- start:176 stop:742 length:567 start_codon:yes stop_codon:yes gene_type:complete